MAMSWRHFDCHTLEIHVTGSLKGRLCNISQCMEQPFPFIIWPQISVNRETLVFSEGKREKEKRPLPEDGVALCAELSSEKGQVCVAECWQHHS